MKLSEIKQHLSTADAVNFHLPSGQIIPEHFHITEVGLTTKHFIDCGGTVRSEKVANLQLWNAGDFDHRLSSEKLLKIISLSKKVLGDEDLEIEVEYQTETIGKYGIRFNGRDFELTAKQTACLAGDNCGSQNRKQKVALSELNSAVCCSPGTGCC